METLIGFWAVVWLGAAGAAPITITAVLQAPVLGIDVETGLLVSVDEAVAPPEQGPKITCNVGRIEDVTRAGPRQFAARYVFPTTRFPQVALIAAAFPGGKMRGFTSVKLSASASPAFRTDPDAEVSLKIGAREFGPQRAGKDGSVRIAVVVPPGIAYGVARSVNRYGKATEQTIDLQLPPFPRLMAMAPPWIAAGTARDVTVYAVDPSGLPSPSSDIVLRAGNGGQGRRGKPQPLGGQPGENSFLIYAPPDLAQNRMEFTVGLRNQPDTDAIIEVPVMAGPPARLAMRTDRPRMTGKSIAEALVVITAEDALGNRVSAANSVLLVDGQPFDTQAASDGRVLASVPVPHSSGEPSTVEIEAALGDLYARDRITGEFVPRGAPGQGESWELRPAPWLALTARLGIAWNGRQQPGPSAFIDALAGVPWGKGAWSAGVGVGYLRNTSVFESTEGITSAMVQQQPVLALYRWRHRAHRRLVIDLGAGAGFSHNRVVLRSFGLDVPAAGFSWALEASTSTGLRYGPGELVLGLRYLRISPGRLSSGDAIRGNTAGMLADMGYRFSW